MDVSNWSEEDKLDFVNRCLLLYKEQNDKILWRKFHEFLRVQLDIPKKQYSLKEWKEYVRQIAENNKMFIMWRAS